MFYLLLKKQVKDFAIFFLFGFSRYWISTLWIGHGLSGISNVCTADDKNDVWSFTSHLSSKCCCISASEIIGPNALYLLYFPQRSMVLYCFVSKAVQNRTRFLNLAISKMCQILSTFRSLVSVFIFSALKTSLCPQILMGEYVLRLYLITGISWNEKWSSIVYWYIIFWN
jgi:hypothetical protein